MNTGRDKQTDIIFIYMTANMHDENTLTFITCKGWTGKKIGRRVQDRTREKRYNNYSGVTWDKTKTVGRKGHRKPSLWIWFSGSQERTCGQHGRTDCKNTKIRCIKIGVSLPFLIFTWKWKMHSAHAFDSGQQLRAERSKRRPGATWDPFPSPRFPGADSPTEAGPEGAGSMAFRIFSHSCLTF